MTVLPLSQRQSVSSSSSWRTAIKTVGIGLALALGFHAIAAELRSIPSASMTPTLAIGDRLVVEKLSYAFHSPRSGDIVVFKAPPELVKQTIKDDLIKRVIGTPGDVVEIRQGKVYVNGKELSEPYVLERPDYGYGPATVPADEYFVLGDNRNHSYDSHAWGFVPSRNIIGHAAFRLAPIRQSGPI